MKYICLNCEKILTENQVYAESGRINGAIYFYCEKCMKNKLKKRQDDS